MERRKSKVSYIMILINRKYDFTNSDWMIVNQSASFLYFPKSKPQKNIPIIYKPQVIKYFPAMFHRMLQENHQFQLTTDVHQYLTRNKSNIIPELIGTKVLYIGKIHDKTLWSEKDYSFFLNCNLHTIYSDPPYSGWEKKTIPICTHAFFRPVI